MIIDWIDTERIQQHIEKFTRDLIKQGPKACRDYLVKLGTHNKDGSITKEYGGK